MLEYQKSSAAASHLAFGHPKKIAPDDATFRL
jgi:hypothetical protein